MPLISSSALIHNLKFYDGGSSASPEIIGTTSIYGPKEVTSSTNMLFIHFRRFKDSGGILGGFYLTYLSYDSGKYFFALLNDNFTTHFFAMYINIFHKTEVETVILMC